jgi:hypothetical protein
LSGPKEFKSAAFGFFFSTKFNKIAQLTGFSSFFYLIFPNIAIFQAQGTSLYVKAGNGVKNCG